MQIRPFVQFALAALVLAAALPACGDAPKAVPAANNSAPSNPHAQAGPHAGGAGGHASFTGRILLKGELAQKDGFLMVSCVPAGARMPMMTYKISLSNASPAVDGVRTIPFLLDASTDMLGGDVPEGIPIELAVRFDADGMVETKDGDVTATVPAERISKGLEVVLQS